MNIMKFLRTPILINIWECLLLYQSKLLMSYYYIAACLTVLKRQSICDTIFSLIFFLFFLLNLNPCVTKIRHMWKNHSIFLLCVYNRFFLVLEVSTKGAAQGHKTYFKGWCLRNSKSTFLILTYFLTQWLFFLIGIDSIQGWTTTLRHEFTRKRSIKRLQHTGNLFRPKATKIISQRKALYR